MSLADINNLGYPVLFSNALVAFLLNVSVVFLVRILVERKHGQR